MKQLVTQYAGLKREIYILFIGKLVTAMGSFVWPMLTFFLTTKLGLSDGMSTLLIATASVLSFPAALLGGKLADRFSRKSIIILFDCLTVSLYLLAAILPQAETLAADGCTLYSGWRQLCRRQFSPERCYLTDDGLALWYPWQVLGPDCAGIPTFLVPYRVLRHRLAREL
jgi:MFS family permease